MTPEKSRPPAVNEGPTEKPTTAHDFTRRGIESQQVDWWAVHEFAQKRIDQAPDYPLLGTPRWCQLDDRDPRKWAAVLDAAQHHAVRIEVAQTAMAEASRAVSAAADWAQIARESAQIREFFAEKPWLRRAPATTASGP